MAVTALQRLNTFFPHFYIKNHNRNLMYGLDSFALPSKNSRDRMNFKQQQLCLRPNPPGTDIFLDSRISSNHNEMVKIALQIKANLECVEKLYTSHPEYQWFLKLKCSSCGEVTEKFHDLTEADKVPQKHNRSETNLIIKCKLCSRENSIDVIEGSNGVLTSDDANKFKTIVIFDCRGVEPVDFKPKSGWIAEAEENGKKFEDVDLSEKEWVEYDEKNKTTVGVYDLEWQFVKVK